jgi:hypothetical protein
VKFDQVTPCLISDEFQIYFNLPTQKIGNWTSWVNQEDKKLSLILFGEFVSLLAFNEFSSLQLKLRGGQYVKFWNTQAPQKLIVLNWLINDN